MQLSTPRLTLRKPILSDFDRFFEMLCDPEAKRYTGGVTKLSYAERRALFEAECAAPFSLDGMEFAVVDTEGRYLGYCGFRSDPALPDKEFLYGFCRDCWGRGIGYEAALAALEYFFAELPHRRYIASADKENAASLRILTRLGFSKTDAPEGADKALDWFSIERGDFNAHRLWEKYAGRDAAPDYLAWQYGSVPDKLAALTLEGVKTATASALPMYELEGDTLPRPGDHSIILDSKERAVCIIKTTAVRVIPFKEVPEEHAYKEGEGDRSLAYWRRVHQEVFTQELLENGLVFSQDMGVVCEEFELAYKTQA